MPRITGAAPAHGICTSLVFILKLADIPRIRPTVAEFAELCAPQRQRRLRKCPHGVDGLMDCPPAPCPNSAAATAAPAPAKPRRSQPE